MRRKLSAVAIAGGLALGLGACEAEGGGTSPGIEDPGTGGDLGTEPGAGGETGDDPLAPADGGEG